MSDGWVKIHRSLLNWEWWDDQNTARLWLTVLLSANHKAEHWHGMTIEAGQFVTSYDKLAARSGLTVKKVRTALEHLKKTGEITVKTANKFSLITVVKWGDFQVQTDEEGKQKANKWQTKGKQMATNKKLKNEKKEKNIYTISPPKYIIQQMNGTLPEETPATEEDIARIKQLQDKMKC